MSSRLHCSNSADVNTSVDASAIGLCTAVATAERQLSFASTGKESPDQTGPHRLFQLHDRTPKPEEQVCSLLCVHQAAARGWAHDLASVDAHAVVPTASMNRRHCSQCNRRLAFATASSMRRGNAMRVEKRSYGNVCAKAPLLIPSRSFQRPKMECNTWALSCKDNWYSLEVHRNARMLAQERS